MWKVRKSTEEITANTTVRAEGYGGWLAVNVGEGNAIVDGYTIEPGEGLDFTSLQPDVIWDSPISIVLETGGIIRLTRLMYKEIKG